MEDADFEFVGCSYLYCVIPDNNILTVMSYGVSKFGIET
jgi:hypothetical protein